MSDDLDRLAALAWDGVLNTAQGDDDPRGPQRRRLIEAARSHPELARLFPFTSMGTLCFSRCSEWPFTTDCPCVGVGRAHEFFVLPDSTVRTGGTDAVLRTPDLDLALQTLIEHLPPSKTVWIGTREDR